MPFAAGVSQPASKVATENQIERYRNERYFTNAEGPSVGTAPVNVGLPSS